MVVDANIFLRYILDDIPSKSSFVKGTIENEEIQITNEILAEIVYVLEKVY